MSNFSKVRLTAAKVIDTIAKKFPETSKAQEIAFILRDLDYEGGDDCIRACLEMADEMEDGENILDSGCFHDVVCDIFYDLGLTEEEGKWGVYWDYAMSVLKK
jgi:hypothetical protein